MRPLEKCVNESDFSRNYWEDKIDQFVFNEKARLMLKRRLLDGIKFEPLAEEFDLSVRQTKNIIYKAEEKVFRHL